MAKDTHTLVERTEPELPTPHRPEPPRTRRRRRSFAWVWLLVIAALGYGGYRYFQAARAKRQAAVAAQAAKATPRAVPVVAAPVRSSDMPVYLRGLGSAAAFNTVSVRSRVDGQLIAIHFQEGQNVKEGDLLAEIDPRPFQVQLEQAQGQLARDQAQLNDAQVNLARYEALWKEQVIARQQLDTQRASVGQFEGAIKSDQAAISNARLQLTYSKVTAPLSGRIGLRQVDVGNIVHASDQNGIAVIAQLQPIAVFFTIPADNLPEVLRKLRGGAHPKVEAYDRDDRTKIATGSLLTVDNQIDPTTGTSRLKAVFDNKDGALFPNQFVNCRLLLDSLRNVTIVPTAAIQRGPQGAYVYIVKADKTADLRNVVTGITEGNEIVVESGIKPGELVVVDGQDKLQQGVRVDARSTRSAGGRRRGA
jgi:membrane fusion protein, multidrug efflux system